MRIFCESIAKEKGELYNEKNKKKEAKPMDIDKVVNVSSEVFRRQKNSRRL